MAFRLAVALLLFTFAALPAAQKRPDFTGTWVEDASRRMIVPVEKTTSKGALEMEEPPQVITQTAERITIAVTFMGNTTRIVHDFDGRENKNRQGAQIHTTRTRWDGDKLVTEGTNFQTTSAGEESWKRREVRWMTAKGEMGLEVTQIDEDGKSRTVTQVFRRER